MSIANLPFTVFASYERANAVALHLNQNEVNQSEDNWTYTLCLHNNGRAIINVYDDDGKFVGLL